MMSSISEFQPYQAVSPFVKGPMSLYKDEAWRINKRS